MAKVRSNHAIMFQGVLSRVSFKKHGDGCVVAMCPGARVKKIWYEQHETVQNFKYGTLYWNAFKSDPAFREFYEARATKTVRAHNIAISDYCIPPKVTYVDLSSYSGKAGKKVRIGATDNVKVVSVHVQLLSKEGAVLEEGEAVQKGISEEWIYTTVTNVQESEVKWIVTAKDMPEHTGSMDMVWERRLSESSSQKLKEKTVVSKEVLGQDSHSQEKKETSLSYWSSHYSGHSSYSYHYTYADVCEKRPT